jgi:hypothetical protein
MLNRQIWTLATGSAAVTVLVAMLSGCQVDAHDKGDGKEVKIATPFGGLHVTTNDKEVLEEVGLPAYPGATTVKKKDNDDGAADVDMSFGGFQLRVKAVGFTTADTPDKVEAFYRGELKRYGDVIKCKDDKPVGTPTRTFEGLSCDSHEGGHVQVDDHPGRNEIELKTGSKLHQRIVSIEPEGGGTKFGLVVLDLPKGSSGNDNDTRQ